MNRLLLASAVSCVLFACGGSTVGDLDSGTDGGGTTDGGGGPGPDSGGGPCNNGACAIGLQCCSDACVNQNNDPLNCGGCGVHCTGSTSMCQAGQCVAPTCAPACTSTQVCCEIDGPGPSGPPKCIEGTTCPVGCPLCQ